MALSYSKQKQIAERYALAGFALAQDANKVQDVSDALQALKAAFAECDDLMRIVKNPMVPANELKSAFNAILASMKADKIASQMVAQLLDNNRLALLPVVADAFLAKADAAQGVVRVDVTSASELSASTLNAIKEALGGDKVALNTKTDASIIGGLVLRQGSRMLDASVSGRLNRMASQLKQTRIETA